MEIRLKEDGGILAGSREWRFDRVLEAGIVLSDGAFVPFSECREISARRVETGLGEGIRRVITDIPGCGDMQLETELLISGTDGHADLTLSAVNEGSACWKEIRSTCCPG